MAYLTAAEVTERLGPTAVGTTAPATIDDLVAEFEEIAEEYRGVAYEPRTEVETFAYPRSVLLLKRPFVRSITSVTADGVTADFSGYTLDGPVGQIATHTYLSAPVVVTYSHGLDAPPKVLLRACAEYVRSVLANQASGQSRDVIAQTFDGGFTRYSTPDAAAGRPTGWLEVDRLLNSLTDHRVPGVA